MAVWRDRGDWSWQAGTAGSQSPTGQVSLRSRPCDWIPAIPAGMTTACYQNLPQKALGGRGSIAGEISEYFDGAMLTRRCVASNGQWGGFIPFRIRRETERLYPEPKSNETISWPLPGVV